jgi:2-polyprenyl-3-methyl-5-hydroxy-6-metoxy-1,4-benzoquinol methylase
MHEHSHDEPSGERFVPEVMGGQLIDAEHQARYRFALQCVDGATVLDAGCGVGWGSKLLHEAGAASVTGLDISPDAVKDSRVRAPECEFVLGDLQSMPFDTHRFDVVVCFEALEHVEDTGAALDELRRVLAPGGLLMVSSPNPAVYPDGNPFHVHELTPDELRESAEARFDNVLLYHQHQMMASVLHADRSVHSTPVAMQVHSVTGFAPTNDPYAVVAASDRVLPDLTSWVCLAPEDQLQVLLRDRQQHLDMLDGLRAEVSQADAAIRATMLERDEAIRRGENFHTQQDASRLQLANLREFADNAARERDDLVSRYVECEQQLTVVTAERDRLQRKLDTSRARVERLKARVERLRQRSSSPAGPPTRASRGAPTHQWRALAGRLRRSRGV